MFTRSFPNWNSISVVEFSKFFKLAATAVAHAAVPQALVNPAPLSQTLTLKCLSFIFSANVTLHFSGNNSWFSISGPKFSKS